MKNKTAEPLFPPARIGILGGGQLAKMMAAAACAMGYDVHIYTDRPDDPALRVTSFSTVGAYDDAEALRAFAASCDVVTYEFENVPPSALENLSGETLLRPGAPALQTARHRVREKSFANARGVPTAVYAPLTCADELADAYIRFGGNGVIKTCSLGYDGKGQIRLKNGLKSAQLIQAWEDLGSDDAVWESFVPFAKEFSVVAARGAGGEFVPFPVAENIHQDGILHKSVVPADIAKSAKDAAIRHTRNIMNTLEYVGVMAAEFFLLDNNDVLLNEIAPRPHNSAHWTIDACVTDQFEQHIRAICGLPLGATDLLCDAVMYNLIGTEADESAASLENPYKKIHFYGKTEARPGRKMGHITELKIKK